MAVKRANLILNWDVLDSFYEQKIYGVNMKPNGFERSFCRCGNTLSTFSDKCECCGNVSFINVKNESLNVMKNPTISFNNNDIIAEGYETLVNDTIGAESFTINGKTLSFEEDKAGKISFKISLKEVAYLGITDVRVQNSRGIYFYSGYFEYKYLKDKYPKAYEVFEEKCGVLADRYNKWGKYLPEFVERGRDMYYSKEVQIDNIELMDRVFLSALLDKNADKFINDPIVSRYPNILKAYILDFFKRYLNWSWDDCTGNDTLEVLFTQLRGHYEAIEFFAKEHNTLLFKNIVSSPSYYSRRPDLSLNSFCQIFTLGCDKTLETGYEDMVFHYVKNGMILFDEAVRIIEQLRTILELRPRNSDPFYGFSDEWLFYKPKNIRSWEESKYKEHIDYRDFLEVDTVRSFFSVYLRETISNRKTHLVEGFIEQIKVMLDYNIPIKEENFKIKNFNFLVNHARLKDVYRLPQEKVDLFLDMFEVNPLEAMSLIANRRKMTKKETEAFLEIMLKQ